LLEKLNIPCIISGPYQYDGASCELAFAAIKKGNINVNNVKVSKTVSILFLF